MGIGWATSVRDERVASVKPVVQRRDAGLPTSVVIVPTVRRERVLLCGAGNLVDPLAKPASRKCPGRNSQPAWSAVISMMPTSQEGAPIVAPKRPTSDATAPVIDPRHLVRDLIRKGSS